MKNFFGWVGLLVSSVSFCTVSFAHEVTQNAGVHVVDAKGVDHGLFFGFSNIQHTNQRSILMWDESKKALATFNLDQMKMTSPVTQVFYENRNCNGPGYVESTVPQGILSGVHSAYADAKFSFVLKVTTEFKEVAPITFRNYDTGGTEGQCLPSSGAGGNGATKRKMSVVQELENAPTLIELPYRLEWKSGSN